MILEDYFLESKIGEGSYGEVYKTIKKSTNEIFATKKVEKQKIMGEKLRQYFMNEIDIIKELNHPNIMKLIDIKTTYNSFYLITEYCNGGTLTENLSSFQKLYKSPFPENLVIHLMKQISNGIKYLHERRIIHRDLKMENILLHYDNIEDKKKLDLLKATVKIIDFGFACKINFDSIVNSIVGSPLNMDPGILRAYVDPNWRSNLRYDEKADIYSIGIIMFYLLIGKAPFNAKNCKELYSKVDVGVYSIPKNLRLSKECLNLMNCMIIQDAEKRYDILNVEKSDFLNKPFEKFEFIDFSETLNEANYKSNFNIKQNENSIFFDIKEIINLEYSQQQNVPENKDSELELLMDQLKINMHNEDSLSKNHCGIDMKKINYIETQENINEINYPNTENMNYPNLKDTENNLIVFENHENVDKYFDKDKQKNSYTDKDRKFNYKELNEKEIFSIPIQKLDIIFDFINKKYEKFEMEAIPIFLDNPPKFKNYIL